MGSRCLKKKKKSSKKSINKLIYKNYANFDFFFFAKFEFYLMLFTPKLISVSR